MMEDDTADEQDLLTSALLESGLDEFLSAPSSPAEPVGRDQRQHFLNKNDQYDGQRCHQDGANTSSANQRGPVITFTATGATTGSRVMTRGGGTGGNVVSSTRLVQRGGSPTMPRGAVSRFAANNTSLPPLPPNSVYTVYKRGGGLVQQQRKQLPGDAYRGAAVVKRGSVGGRRVRPPRGSTTSRNIPSSSSTGPERTFVHLNSKGEQITYRLVPTDDNDAPAFAQEDADADDDLTFHLSRGAAVSPLVSSIALKPAQAKLAQQQQQQAYQRSQVFVHRGNASTVRMRGGARIRGPSTPHSLTPAHHSYSSSNSYSYRMATGGRLRPALALHKDVPEERRIVKNQDAPVSFQTANVHDYACTATVSTSRQQPAIIRKSSSPAAATGVAASRSRSATPNPALSSSNSTTTTIQPQQSLEVSSANAPAPTAAMTVVPVTSEPIHTLVTQPSSRQAVAQLQPQFYSCATASSSSANQSVAAGGKRPRKEPPEDVHGSPVVVKHGGKEVNLSTTKLMPVSVKPLPVKYEPARIHLPRKKTPSPPIVVTKPRPISPAIQLAPTIVSETIDVETVDVAPIIATTSALSSGMLAATKNEPSVPLSVSTPAAGKTEPQPPVKPKKERKPKEAEKGKPFATLAAPADTSTAADDELDENLGHADTYSEYQPAKLRSGLPHPDCVVETASLSSVAPPDIRHMLTLPEELIDRGAVSALQLEAVLYACQMHENRLPSGERVGYLIGDGAGVGKGRTLACIIFENYLIGRKRSLWFSVSADLKYDSERDLRDVGASKIRVASLSKFKYAKISGKENGAFKKGVLFATYSSLVGECRTAKSKYRSRIKQLIQWCGHDFDGVIVFDECHRAKNLVPIGGTKPTKTGLAVLEIQRALPNARVVYASATGATEPRNMAYMTRLGLWGPGQPFPEFGDFINAVERRGVGAMEIVAIDMKQRGLYLARQLSFRGVTFRVEEVALSPEFIEIYDDSVKLWLEARRQFQAASKSVTDAQQKLSKQMWAQFWACHQRFFKYLCIAAKVDACVRLAREGLKNGKCVVIGLQSTGEARTLEQLEEAGGELTEFVSTAKAVLMSLIEKQFPTAEHSASYGNVFEDFGIGGASKVSGKRKREIMADFDAPMLKRMREDTESVDVESNSSSTSENDDGDRHAASDDAGSTSGGGDSDGDSHSESEESTVEDNSDGGEKEPGEDDWLQTLIAQAESSSSEEEDDDETSDNDDRDSSKEPTATTTTATDAANKSTDDDSQRMAGGGSQRSTDDDFNPFAMDSADDDPWVAKQQLVEDSSPEKARRREEAATGSTTAADKLVRSERKRKKKKKKKRAKGDKEKRQIRSEAQQGTAADFLASSRTIDDVDQLNSGHDPFGTSSTGGSLNLNRALVVKAELMAAAEKLGERLPPNTLDELIDELGGADKVAEMTGRKGRIVSKEGGDVGYELRHEVADVRLEMMNMDEKLKFMDGRKLIAIISEAASSGISLQSDRRAQNQRRRVHITLELPWSADKAIQQFGRTHRSNQVNAPEYIFMISELAGEKRFASVVAKRLESLGALTHGDRRATETRDLSQFNMDNRYGRAALEVVLKSIVGHIKPPFIPPPKEYTSGDFIQDMCHYLEGVGMLSYENGAYTIERETANIPKFLNRLLGLPVHAQNALFQYFADSTAELIARSKRDGTFDLGILDLGIGGDRVRKLETRVFLGRIDRGSYRTEMHKIGVERGVSWEEVLTLYREHNTDDDGFYVSTVGLHGKLAACLIYAVGKKRLDSGGRLFCITRPNTGRSPRLETYGEIKKRFRKVDVQQAEDLWRDQYLRSNEMCQHSYFHGKCRNEQSGVYCEIGRRTRTYFVLSGSVLSVWPVVEEVLQGGGASTKRVSRIQVIRVRTEQDQKIVGLLVLPQFVRTLIQKLEEHCGRSYLDQASEQKQKPSTSRGQ